MMRLKFIPVAKWPKLAWTATMSPGQEEIEVWHGPMVETSALWCVEAAWAGRFEEGNFDLTDMIFGTGIRCRGEYVTFVSSGSALDRLWYCRRESRWCVSNSLPAMLAMTGDRLREDYHGYPADMNTIEELGLRGHRPSIPTRDGEASLVYFRNLRYNGVEIEAKDKPSTWPEITNFNDYFQLLVDCASALGENITSPGRKYAITPMVGISSGYDSPAAAVISRFAGCNQAVTICNPTSLWRGSDSGREIAVRLGMSCKVYWHRRDRYRKEVALWAASGRPGGLNMTLFDYSQPLCLFFCGNYGDKVWDRFHHDLSNPVGDSDCLISEFRLLQGIFFSVVPWWGIRQAQEINSLGAKEEMKPWTLDTNYDRPVARRIVEEAGISRRLFGRRKKNTASCNEFYWPFTNEARDGFSRYLEDLGLRVPSDAYIRLATRIAHWENLLAMNLTRKLGMDLKIRERMKVVGQNLLFQWANDELKSFYNKGLQEGTLQAVSSVVPGGKAIQHD
jgi:hypothetical protein